MDSVRIYCYAALRNLYAIFSVIIIYTDFFVSAILRTSAKIQPSIICRSPVTAVRTLRHIRQKAGVYWMASTSTVTLLSAICTPFSLS